MVKKSKKRKSSWKYSALKYLNEIPYLNKKAYLAAQEYIDIYRGFSYEFEENGEKNFLKKCNSIYGKSNITIFDVGANVGNWTSEAQKALPMSKCHLFEVSDLTFKNLLNRFNGQENIILNNVALSDFIGEIKFKDFGENHGSNTTVVQGDFNKRESNIRIAQALKGIDYCSANDISHINILKIDTEGSEFSVLKGFSSFLEANKIDLIQFEYGYVNADAGVVMRDFYKLLENAGYRIGALRQNGVRFSNFSYSANDFKSGPNYIAALPKFVDQLETFG